VDPACASCGDGGILSDRKAFRSEATAFYASQRKDSSNPDIFLSREIGKDETDVDGFTRAAGEWGQLYCGDFEFDGESWSENMSVCP
jgi:hypothetical protein